MMGDWLTRVMEEYGVNAEQGAALDLGESMAVKAGAGSGKTRVLTRRYLRLLKEEAAGVEQIVAITFTEKAALEMKERIRELIGEEIAKAKTAAERKKWREVRDAISAAPISTIHSFCGALVRENCAVLGVDPEFAMIDEIDRETSLRKFAREAVDSCFLAENCRDGARALVELYDTAFILKERGGLVDCLLGIYRGILEQGLSFAAVGELTSLTAKLAKLKECGEDYAPEMIVLLSRAENFALQAAEVLHQKYTAFKEEKGVLDFNDLELLAARLLEENQAIRDYYRQRYRFFLVDEFQDTNVLQKRILYSLVCDAEGRIVPRKLFIVGDYKQSIYGFRGADCTILETVCEDLGEAKVKRLSTCYRSLPPVIDTINALFEKLIAPYESLMVAEENRGKVGKPVELIAFPKEENSDPASEAWEEIKQALRPGKSCEELQAALAKLKATGEESTHADQEAEILAGRIRELVREGFAYRDIAVLMRSRGNLKEYETALAKARIPYCVLGGIGFFDRQEVVDLINTYKAVCDADDRLALVGALRSPVFALSDKTMVAVMEAMREQDDAGVAFLDKAAEKIDAPEQSANLRRAKEILGKLRGFAGLLSAYELLQQVVAATQYAELLLAGPDGFRKYRNLEKLLQLAREFDAKNLYSPREFPAYLETMAEHGTGEGEAALDTEDSDAVKLLTIHAAKGLEFRAVLIPGLHKELTYHTKHHKPKLAFDPDFGIVAIGKNEKDEYKAEINPLYRIYYEQRLEREVEEAKRLLYVAATRAREFLALIGEDQAPGAHGELNTFMRQVKYALAQCGGGLPSLVVRDGRDLRVPEGTGRETYLARVKDLLARPAPCGGEQGRAARLSWRYEGTPGLQASITQYLAFKQCPRQYFWEYKAGLRDLALGLEDGEQEDAAGEENGEAEMLAATRRGTVVHRILEGVAHKCLTREQVDGEIAAVLQWALPPDAEGDRLDAYFREIRRYIDGYFKIEEAAGAENHGKKLQILTELPFRLLLSPGSRITINGVIDRLDLYAGEDGKEAVLIDYKTNRICRPAQLHALTEYYTPQLLLYARAVERLLRHAGEKIRIKKAMLYFLDAGEYCSVPYDGEAAEALLAEMEKSFAFIAGHERLEDYAACRGENCASCGFAGLCG